MRIGRKLQEGKAMKMEEKHDSCGVFGIYRFDAGDVSIRLYNGLVTIQHRGQDSAGMATFDGKRIHDKRGGGLVSDIFSQKDIEKLQGWAGVGHTRYPTVGGGGPEDAQPTIMDYPKKGIALAHNGNIANFGLMRKELGKTGHHFYTDCDAEVILHCFVDEFIRTKEIFSAVEGCMERLEGSYSVVLITGDGEMVVFRDPYAFRPLCWGEREGMIAFASESVCLDINEIPLKGDVKAGEAILITKKGVERRQIKKPAAEAHCMFEYVYFSRPDSVLDGRLVYEARMSLGKALAKVKPVKADIVIPVPDSSRPAALGYSAETGIPVVEGLIKNRYVGRTFIMPSQEKRNLATRLKLNAVKSLIRGKRVLLIDDSIVRGTTVGPIIGLVRAAGAKEVHLRITCPPIVAPCFYGIDIPDYEQLIAAKNSGEEMRKKVGADSLAFLSVDELVKAIGFPKDKLCLGCLTNKYPTEYGEKLAKCIKENDKKGGRPWEEGEE